MQQKSVVTIFSGWHTIFKTLIQIVGRVKAIAPGFVGKRWIGYDEVEYLEVTVALLKVGAGERIVLPDFGCGVVVQDHIHLSQCSGSIVHFLSVDCHTSL